MNNMRDIVKVTKDLKSKYIIQAIGEVYSKHHIINVKIKLFSTKFEIGKIYLEVIQGKSINKLSELSDKACDEIINNMHSPLANKTVEEKKQIREIATVSMVEGYLNTNQPGLATSKYIETKSLNSALEAHNIRIKGGNLKSERNYYRKGFSEQFNRKPLHSRVEDRTWLNNFIIHSFVVLVDASEIISGNNKFKKQYEQLLIPAKEKYTASLHTSFVNLLREVLTYLRFYDQMFSKAEAYNTTSTYQISQKDNVTKATKFQNKKETDKNQAVTNKKPNALPYDFEAPIDTQSNLALINGFFKENNITCLSSCHIL